MTNMTDETLVGSVLFTDEDCEAIASINLPALKGILTEPQFVALQKFVFVNQITSGPKNDQHRTSI